VASAGSLLSCGLCLRQAYRQGLARGRVYGDVLSRLVVVRLTGDPAADFARVGPEGGMVEESVRHGFAFWNPDGSRYATKSVPPGRSLS
jgi:hypothetical protein